MIRHENNDPRETQRERARQGRLTRNLSLVIGLLVTLMVAVLLWRSGYLR